MEAKLGEHFGIKGISIQLREIEILTAPKPKGIRVETFRIDYLIRTPKVEKFSLQPIRISPCPGACSFCQS